MKLAAVMVVLPSARSSCSCTEKLLLRLFSLPGCSLAGPACSDWSRGEWRCGRFFPCPLLYGWAGPGPEEGIGLGSMAFMGEDDCSRPAPADSLEANVALSAWGRSVLASWGREASFWAWAESIMGA